MNYNLNQNDAVGKEAKAAEKKKSQSNSRGAVVKLLALLKEEKWFIVGSLVALLINAGANLVIPYLTGIAVDQYITRGIMSGLRTITLILVGVSVVGFVANYLQIKVMGGVGQRMLFKLRNLVFKKLEELPLEFFNQNKAGDLISRINGDTERLSQFFSETLTRFLGGIFMIGGAGVFLVIIHFRLGVATLLPALGIAIGTRLISSYVKKANKQGLKSGGLLSAEVQESLQNFKVIVAFNRRDYFRDRFDEINKKNYKANIKSGIYNGIFTPVYDFAANLGQYAVLVYGIYLISSGNVTIGMLVAFLAYAERFYNPLKQMAELWAQIQISLAAWDRISNILALTTNMPAVEESKAAHKVEASGAKLLEFKDVCFHYADADADPKTHQVKNVLDHATFTLEEGKTYALVGPTGGGKTTTASLMARLYDPSSGEILLHGKNIKDFTAEERTSTIGFILQDPIVFAGTLRDNFVYGNSEYENLTDEELEVVLKEHGLSDLIERFEGGLAGELPKNIDSMSLGQKQILAFVRAVLRKPALLILDEATANIDTVTEQVLEQILEKLPLKTTKVIIAHRLNTIQNADEIFFVNSAKITRAGSMQDALDMLLKGKKTS